MRVLLKIIQFSNKRKLCRTVGLYIKKGQHNIKRDMPTKQNHKITIACLEKLQVISEMRTFNLHKEHRRPCLETFPN